MVAVALTVADAVAVALLAVDADSGGDTSAQLDAWGQYQGMYWLRRFCL